MLYNHAFCARSANRSARDSTNIIIILGMMQVSKRIPFDDPDTLNIVRAVYIASNLIIAVLYLYTQVKINSKKGTHTSNRPSTGASLACGFSEVDTTNAAI